MGKDYFSGQAALYSRFRPRYPAALFDYLCADLDEDALVWDCATGNGQAAVAIAGRGRPVVATDLSRAQLAHARRAQGVHYVCALAEATPLRTGSVALVTVAQALHWFDFERFHAEVRRVLRPGGRIAAWTYSFMAVSAQLGAALDAELRTFYRDVVGPFWPPERRWVDEAYRTVPFPYEPVGAPEFAIALSWDLAGLLGYLSSWSATQRLIEATGKDPLPALAARLAPLWGAPGEERAIRWPLGLRVGRT